MRVPEQAGKKPMQIFVASLVVSFVDPVSDKARDKARDKVLGTRPHGMKIQTINAGHNRQRNSHLIMLDQELVKIRQVWAFRRGDISAILQAT